MTDEPRAIHLRSAFLALPGAVEAPDGDSIVATCPACAAAGAAVLADDTVTMFGPGLAELSCSNGCEPLEIAQALAYPEERA